MTAETVIRQAAAEGVRLFLSPPDRIEIIGKEKVVDRWIPVIRENKPGIVAVLSDQRQKLLPTAPTIAPDERWACAASVTPEAELTALVNLVADYPGFTVEQRQEGLEIALTDLDAALDCFRILAARIPQSLRRNHL